MTLNEYIEIEKNCRRCIKDNEGYFNNLEKAKELQSQLEQEYQHKLDSISSNKETYVRDRIRTEVENATVNLKAYVSTREKQLSQLGTKVYSQDAKAITEYYEDYTNLATRVLSVIKEKQKNYTDIARIVSKAKVNFNDKDALDKLYNLVEKYEKELNSIAEVYDFSSKVNGATGWIFKGSSLAVRLDGPARLLFTVVYYLLLAFLVVIFPEIFFIYVSLICFIYLKRNIKVRKRQSVVIRKMGYFATLCKGMLSMVQQRVDTKIKDLNNKEKQADTKTIKKLQAEVKAGYADLEETELRVKTKVLENASSDAYEREQRLIVESEYKDRLQEAKEDVKDLTENYEVSLAEHEELIRQRDEGKAELEATYFKLDKGGTSKILPRKFLLGFNEYVPVTLDMPDYCINLPANMKASESISKFIFMCVTQILCTTNPSCVNISIVDLVNGTSTYGMFGFLSEIITIVKTQEELNKKIAQLYETKTERDTSIKSKFDNIEELNNYIISQYGITKTYEILIITHQIDSLFTDKIFRQLQTSGDVGIITITVWDKNIFMYNPKKSVEYYTNILEYVPQLKNITYFGDNGELNEFDEKYVRAKMQDIAIQIRRR